MSKKAHNKNWRSDPLENTPPVRGSGNFLKDRGYADLTVLSIPQPGEPVFPHNVSTPTGVRD